MIDRNARDAYAEVLRHFIAGRLTNDEYDRCADDILDRCSPEDRGPAAVYSSVWFLYDDLRTHRLTGKSKVPRKTRRELARCIIFLHSDLEYEWPIRSFISIRAVVLNIFTFGLAYVVGRLFEPVVRRRMNKLGTWDLWPFFREIDFHRALASPRLLSGISR